MPLLAGRRGASQSMPADSGCRPLLSAQLCQRRGNDRELRMQGPSVTVDTACSSSLVALHIARQSMASGACSRGLAAGVNLPMNWQTTALFVAARMTAPDGRCKTLDAAADGYVRAEACVCIALRCGHGFARALDAHRTAPRPASQLAPAGPSHLTAWVAEALQRS